MVLTDLPFSRSPLLHQRYNSLLRPDRLATSKSEGCLAEKNDDTTQAAIDYASFLKDQERKVGPYGFLDSKKYTHTYAVAKERPPSRSSAQSSNGCHSHTAVSLITAVNNEEKGYQRRIKVIEDHMWQHKQEERELKRLEGDIIKNQRTVRNLEREIEQKLTKKRMNEEKKLNVSLGKYTKLQQDSTHRKHEFMKDQIGKNQIDSQVQKDVGRKIELQKSDLARKYRLKISELDLKRIEMMRLSQAFNNQLQQKEEEQFELKKELADLAINLNMERLKEQQIVTERNISVKKETNNVVQQKLTEDRTLENKLIKSDADVKSAEMNKRRLNSDLALTKSHLSIKARDEQRHLTDTQIRLRDNSVTQRQLNNTAMYAELDHRAQKIEQNIQVHNVRRHSQMQQVMQEKRVKSETQETTLEEKFQKRRTEQKQRKYDDTLKVLHKLVIKGDDEEQNLYTRVRNSEYSRQKQEQNVRKLQQKLSQVRQRNAVRLKDEAAAVNKTEQELEQQLTRQQAELDKTHAQREETYIRLQQHRAQLREDRFKLSELERENGRALRIGVRSGQDIELGA